MSKPLIVAAALAGAFLLVSSRTPATAEPQEREKAKASCAVFCTRDGGRCAASCESDVSCVSRCSERTESCLARCE